MKIYALISLMILVSTTPILAAAPEHDVNMPAVSALVPVPDEMQQRWVLGGCEKGQMVSRLSRRYLMVSIPQESRLFRLGGLTDAGNGRYIMTMPEETTGLMLGSTGKLIQYFDDLNASFSREKLEAQQLMIPHITYDNCTDAAEIPVKEDPLMLALLPALDDIQEACAAAQDIRAPGCQESVFALFDGNGDKMLDKAELGKSWEILTAYSPFGICSADAAATDSLYADGSAYIAWLMEHADQDKDSRIALAELTPLWVEMQGDPLMSGLTNLLIAADTQIGILPETIKVTCVNCCVVAR